VFCCQIRVIRGRQKINMGQASHWQPSIFNCACGLRAQIITRSNSQPCSNRRYSTQNQNLFPKYLVVNCFSCLSCYKEPWKRFNPRRSELFVSLNNIVLLSLLLYVYRYINCLKFMSLFTFIYITLPYSYYIFLTTVCDCMTVIYYFIQVTTVCVCEL